jgi:hypothetical protein
MQADQRKFTKLFKGIPESCSVSGEGGRIVTAVCKNQRLCAKNRSRTLFVIEYFFRIGPLL